jgi:bleomycin hydrolase
MLIIKTNFIISMFNLKKHIASGFAVAMLMFFAGQAWSQETFQFTDVKKLPASSVKNQASSSTCWCFSGISFFESEMMRMGKKDIPDLSEMFVVDKCYNEKAERFVRMHGKINFAGGGAFHDLLWAIKNYGLVPELAFSGLRTGEKFHNHGEMDEALKNYVELVAKNENKISPVWESAFAGIKTAYLGTAPDKFSYGGKEYSPRTFADQVVGINPSDYIEITSFNHHPFYTKFALEVPDNWLWGEMYNVPLADFGQIIDNALNNGYTVAWASDVSEKYFNYGKGVALVPDIDVSQVPEGDRAKFEKMSERERENFVSKFEGPVKEREITQELRQTAFDNYATQDDHGMHITGLATDQKGNKYYLVKNSWGEGGKFSGYFYASQAFVLYKSTCIMIHKDAVPKALRTKLGF